MKTIKLWVNNEGWKEFQYNELSDLNNEFSSRNICIGNWASIGYGASIGDKASIGYGASIGDRASIGDGASIGHRASIGYGASIGYRASIGNEASIGYGASIGNWASIGDGASIGYRASIIRSLFITGSKHTVTWYSTEDINIGCYKLTITEWLKKFEKIGEKEGYTPEQIKEYHGYILMCKQLYESL